MKKMMMFVFLLMTIACNGPANEDGKGKDVQEKVFHVAANSTYEGIRFDKDGDFFYLGKIIVRPDSYEIQFIDYDIKPDTTIAFRKKDGNIRYRYENQHLPPQKLHIKTYGEIFEFEKEEFPQKLEYFLFIKDGVMNIDIIEKIIFASHRDESEHYYISFYDDKKVIRNGKKIDDDGFEKMNISFDEGLKQILPKLHYYTITPEFAHQLEKEKRFYIGGVEDVKDHISWK